MSFWETWFTLIIFLPMLVLWIGCVIDIIGRPDLSGLAKVAWMLGVLIFPFIGALVYVFVRPKQIIEGPSYVHGDWGADEANFPTSAQAQATRNIGL